VHSSFTCRQWARCCRCTAEGPCHAQYRMCRGHRSQADPKPHQKGAHRGYSRHLDACTPGTVVAAVKGKRYATSRARYLMGKLGSWVHWAERYLAFKPGILVLWGAGSVDDKRRLEEQHLHLVCVAANRNVGISAVAKLVSVTIVQGLPKSCSMHRQQVAPDHAVTLVI
jgi:hypothetical protein